MKKIEVRKMIILILITISFIINVGSFSYFANRLLVNSDELEYEVTIGKWESLPDTIDGGIGNSSGGKLLTLDMLGKTKDELGIELGNYDTPFPLDGNYILVDDIDLKGQITKPIGNFSGTLDGNGYKISNTTITEGIIHNNKFIAGLFGMSINEGKISNLVIENVNIDVTCQGKINAYAAPLVAFNNGIIENVKVVGGTVKITNIDNDNFWTHASGLVGENGIGGIIANCYSRANVDIVVDGVGEKSVVAGGLVGKNVSGAILNCYATGDITLTRHDDNKGVFNIGGLVGHVHGFKGTSVLRNSFATGNISVDSIHTKNRTIRLGYLVGELEGTTSLSYNYYSDTQVLSINEGKFNTSTTGTRLSFIKFKSAEWEKRTWNKINLRYDQFPKNPEYVNANAWSKTVWLYVEGEYPDLLMLK